MDNGGNYSSGDFRTGLFYTVKSLSGERDALTIGTIRSEGSKAASVSYNRSLGHSGTRLNASYSGNSVRAVRSPSDSLGVVGHSYSYSIGLVQPVVVNEKTRSEVSFEYNWQGSKSELRKTEGNHLNHDKMHDGTLAFALTDYGRSHVFYQKHGLSYGKSKSLSNSSNDYLYYKFYGLYHKSYPRGQAINLRGEAQWSKAHEADELISSRQFYIGGAYSVRGFKESYMSGNSGYLFSAEYQVPVTKDRNTNAFVFYDYGHVYQSKESSNRERVLSSVGIGLKSKLTEKISASLSLGCPLKTEFAGKMDQVSKTRLNFMVSGQF